MKFRRISGEEGGFSLVEILVVTAMMGLVAMAVYSLYQTTQRTATTQDNVVELQQNLRVALDRMERDIRMAGFMVPPALTPLSDANANTFTLRTASATGRIARLNLATDVQSPASNTDELHLTVASADMADLFDTTSSNIVRIIRPPNQNQPMNQTFTVAGKDRTVPRITLTGFSTPGVIYRSGDVIVRTAAGAPDPNTVTYALGGTNGDELIRTANAGSSAQTSETVASGLTSLQFWYLLDDNTRTSAPTATQMSDIKAVEIRMAGQAASQEGAKTREIQGVVIIRNR